MVGEAVFALLTLSSVVFGSCPNGYQPASPNKCFKAFNKKTTYCNAQETCARHGGRLVEGSEWFRILSNGSSAPWQAPGFTNRIATIRTGLTDFLDERDKDKNGWQWSSGERVPASVVHWDNKEPNNLKSHQDCTSFFRRFKFKLADRQCNKLDDQFICEPVPPKRPTQFEPTSPDPVTPNGFAYAECKTLFENLELLDCFTKCFDDQFGCKAMYFSDQLKRCIVVRFNDASVEIKDPSLWRKFKSVG